MFRSKTRQYSQKEKDLRDFHWELLRLKKWCERNEYVLHDVSNAELTDICILSSDEHLIGEQYNKHDWDVFEGEHYFISQEGYDSYYIN